MLEKSFIRGFNINTLNESQMLKLTQEMLPDVNDIGKRYSRKIFFVSWPHLIEARVVAVANTEWKYRFEPSGEESSATCKLNEKAIKMPMMPEDLVN
jgi:hypothetical protein